MNLSKMPGVCAGAAAVVLLAGVLLAGVLLAGVLLAAALPRSDALFTCSD
jgi:hypothetical protein